MSKLLVIEAEIEDALSHRDTVRRKPASIKINNVGDIWKTRMAIDAMSVGKK